MQKGFILTIICLGECIKSINIVKQFINNLYKINYLFYAHIVQIRFILNNAFK